MQNVKYIRLRTDCSEALADDNLEKCYLLLSENLVDGQNRLTLIEIKGRLTGLMREWNGGRMAFDEYSLHRNQIRSALLQLVYTSLKPEDISLLGGIHDRILIIACKNSPTNWERLFPDYRFSHKFVIQFSEIVPREFKNPDVVIFDDLKCPGLMGNKNEMKKLALEMPLAHLLYVGDPKSNPFTDSKLKDEQEIYARMTNANSHLTIHGRLNDLLEFRKNYGLPMSTHIAENMKDKLPLQVFISYSHRDEDWKNELDMHLATMKRQGLITVWQDRKIAPGSEWDDEIKKQMEQSHLIFFMVSPGFMASEYIMDKEVPLAMSLYAEGKSKVLPIFVKDVEWKGSEFGKLQGLPRDQKFLDMQPNKDQGLATVARAIRELIENWEK